VVAREGGGPRLWKSHGEATFGDRPVHHATHHPYPSYTTPESSIAMAAAKDRRSPSRNFSHSRCNICCSRPFSALICARIIFYYAEDMLGSSRALVQAGQTSVCYDADFYPYDGEKVVTNTCPQNYKFEGKERDTETGNDDFGARYYSSVYGRWLSPDWSSVPAPVPYANLNNPQTLNLYAMVADNPETFADLDGHACDMASAGPASAACDVHAAAQGQQQPQTQSPQQLSKQVSPETKKAIAESLKASNSPTADDKKGGFHEEGGQSITTTDDKKIVQPAQPGAYSDPSKDKLATMDTGKSVNPVPSNSVKSVENTYHIHPGGSVQKGDKTYFFNQPPSAEDISGASAGLNIVVGARDKQVYFYNSSGNLGEMSLKDFMKEPQ